MILAGDIGGTNTRLALFGDPAGEPENLQTFSSRAHAGLGEIVAAYCAGLAHPPGAACFGVAGPVRDGVGRVTNLPWTVDAAALATQLGTRAWVINDLEANAHGVAVMPPTSLVELHAGRPEASGNRAIIAAGTGLGEAGLYWDGVTHQPFACEGGHASFAPGSPLEDELLVWLRAKYAGHVSWERVVSGMGIVNLHDFLRQRAGQPDPEFIAAVRRSGGDPGAAISNAGLAGTDPICVETLDWLVALYGAEAGNLALKLMATAGLYVGGGIAPRILDKLRDGRFAEAFLAKGRMRATVMEAIPVRVILDDHAALRGSARCAALRLGGS
ncbi:MAG: glucokinase [bacterium]|nr:glucokinase [bacterium]